MIAVKLGRGPSERGKNEPVAKRDLIEKSLGGRRDEAVASEWQPEKETTNRSKKKK